MFSDRVYHCHHVMGAIYQSKGETEKAVHHFEIVPGIASALNWAKDLSCIHSDLADVFIKQNRFSNAVRTHSDTIPISSNPEPYHLISPPHLNLAIPFPVSLLWTPLPHISLVFCFGPSLVVTSDPLRTLVGLSPLCSLVM